jgi:hypothetical protein
MSKSKPFTAKELKSLIRQYKSKNCLPYSKLNRDGLIKYILNVKKLKDVYTKLKSKKTGKKDQSQITEFYNHRQHQNQNQHQHQNQNQNQNQKNKNKNKNQ